MPERVSVLGYPLDRLSLDQAVQQLQVWLAEPAGVARTVVTLNPEILVQAGDNPQLATCIRAADLVVADGVGVVWAAKQLGRGRFERVPGIELCTALLARSRGLTVYLLGGRPGVAERAARAVEQRFGAVVIGAEHGYFSADAAGEGEVVARIRASGAKLLLSGLGAGRQEIFHGRHRQALGVQVAIGVGGSLDVLAGAAKRAPAWTSKLGLEWAWRVGLQPGRWHRAPRLARFAWEVRRAARRPD
jgi:N-acetylglucosaminyldiphosphoundecaprenol N-acetyl-beta-D-mannosaminyltransferase